MRTKTLAIAVASVLFGAGVAQAGDHGMTKDQFKAADTNADGSLTLAEAQAANSALASKFTSVDTDADGKISSSELDTWSKSSGGMEADQSRSTSSTTPSSTTGSDMSTTGTDSSSTDKTTTDK